MRKVHDAGPHGAPETRAKRWEREHRVVSAQSNGNCTGKLRPVCQPDGLGPHFPRGAAPRPFAPRGLGFWVKFRRPQRAAHAPAGARRAAPGHGVRPGKKRRGGHGRWRARPNGTSQGTPGACWPRSTPCRPAPLAHNSAAAAPDPRRGSAAPRGSASAAQQLVACHHGARLPHVRVQIPGGGRRGHGPGARHAAAPPAADPRPHSARSSLPMQPARRRRSLPPLWRAAALSSLRCRARR